MPPASAAIAQNIGSRLDRRVSLYAPGAGTWTYREFADPAKRLALRTVEDGRVSKSRVVAIKLNKGAHPVDDREPKQVDPWDGPKLAFVRFLQVLATATAILDLILITLPKDSSG
jgi:hypothetical protein